METNDKAHVCTFTGHRPELLAVPQKKIINWLEEQIDKAIAEDLFAFINSVYDELGGFKSFKDVAHFVDDSYLWFITYDGPRPTALQDFDIKKVLVVSVFRNNNGLKLVGLARRKIGKEETDKRANMELRRNANNAVVQHIRFVSKIGWAEVSDKLEEYFKKTLTIQDIIDPYELQSHKIFKNMEIDPYDEFHYYRPLRTGETPTRKIAYGNIKW